VAWSLYRLYGKVGKSTHFRSRALRRSNFFHNILRKFFIILFVKQKLDYNLHWWCECVLRQADSLRPVSEDNARVTGNETVFTTFFTQHLGHSTVHFHCIVHQVLKAKYNQSCMADVGLLELLNASVETDVCLSG